MVGAYCASSSSLLKPVTTAAAAAAATTTSTKPLLPPRKLTRRKNHLRPKILKTLPKPLILPQPPQTNPIIPIISTPETDAVFDSPTVETTGIVPAVEEFEETQFSATEGVAATDYGGVSGNSISAESFLRIGLGLVGVFVLQTICSVWILGKASNDEKDKNLNVVEKNVNGINNGKLLANKDVVCLDRMELDYRINEIRAMAREAREIEAKNVHKEDDIVDEEDKIVDEDVSSKGRIGFGEEISARLVKVEKQLGSMKGRVPGLNLNGLEEFEEDDEDDEADEKLMFKKKFKFRSPSSISSRSDDVKGFGSDDCNAYEKKKSGLAGPSDDSKKNSFGTVELEKNGIDALNVNVNGSQNDMKSWENTSTSFGTVQGTSQGRSSIAGTKSRQQNFVEENQETSLKSNRDAVMGRNNGSKHSVLGKKSDIESDLWWLKLPYVLAILMRRGPEHEEAGFFTLRGTSQIPYTVAFENHGDANNFCYLLDSYFEDLGDFNADIVPLPVKELHDAVKSNTKKVIVVKKGQLKLYAGQPFADVEMALHSLIE